jgi:hypothetical protein
VADQLVDRDPLRPVLPRPDLSLFRHSGRAPPAARTSHPFPDAPR